jgi:YD repeat-containing protein
MPNAKRRMPKAAWCALLVTALVTHGCNRDPDRERLRRTTRPEYDEKTGRLERLTYDANKDGYVDTWVHMDGPRIVRTEVDRDQNGRIDRWAYPDDKGGLMRVEEDTNGDGRADKWESYTDGRLVSATFDETGDGRPDRRLNYDAAGRLVSIESEPDDRGSFKKKIDVP